MTRFRFIHAADIHLDSALRGLARYPGAPVAEIRSATRRAFDNLVTLAIEEEVAFVLLAGDLYDGDWKDYNTGLYFISRMNRLRQAGIRVFIVAGNHDAASQITRHLRLPDNVRMFSSKSAETAVLEDCHVAIHGQSFATRAVTDDLSKNYPAPLAGHVNIGLLHTALEGRPGHEPYAPCHADDLRAKGYQYWALGHVHRREVVAEAPWIVFPGNIQGRHIRETGPRGCMLVSVAEGDVETVEPRDLDVLRWARIEVDISGTDSTDEVDERLQAAMQEALDAADGRPVAARLRLSGRCPVARALRARRDHWIEEYRALANGLGAAGLWLEKVEFDVESPRTGTLSDASADALAGLMQALDAIERDDAALSTLLAELESLRKKLPPEWLHESDEDSPLHPDNLRSAIDDVRELLLDRLLSAGDAS